MKLEAHKLNVITLEQLRILLLEYYWGKGGYNETDLGRKLFITKIKNCNGGVGTIVFSIDGSPPKGVAILYSIVDEVTSRGMMVFVGRNPTRPKRVCIEELE